MHGLPPIALAKPTVFLLHMYAPIELLRVGVALNSSGCGFSHLNVEAPGQQAASLGVLQWLQERLPHRQLLIVVRGFTLDVSTHPQLRADTSAFTMEPLYNDTPDLRTPFPPQVPLFHAFNV